MSLLVKAMRHPGKAFTALIHGLLGNVTHQKFKRFIVLSRSRTGSNMLISFLGAHPSVRVEGEILQRVSGQSINDVVARAFADQPLYTKAKGFKVFYYHPLDDRSGDAWDYLVSMDDLAVIHLKRRNILRTLISRKIAGLQGVWEVSSSDTPATNETRTVTLTVGELKEGFEKTREWERRGDEMFKGHPLLTVFYEDLVSDPEESFGRVTDFLGVRHVQPTTALRKQNQGRLRDTVENYDDLRSEFSGTQWAAFFEE